MLSMNYSAVRLVAVATFKSTLCLGLLLLRSIVNSLDATFSLLTVAAEK